MPKDNSSKNEEEVEIGSGFPQSKQSYIKYSYINNGKRKYIYHKILPYFNRLLIKEINKYNDDNYDDSKIILLYSIYDSRNDNDFKQYLLNTKMRLLDEEFITVIDKFIDNYLTV